MSFPSESFLILVCPPPLNTWVFQRKISVVALLTKFNVRGCRDGSVAKGTYLLLERTVFSFLSLHGDSRLPVSPVPEVLTTSSRFPGLWVPGRSMVLIHM